MENAVNALKMAAAVLIFIIAIGTSFSLIGTAKQTSDSIVKVRDKQEYLQSEDLDTILYTSSDKIQKGTVSRVTENGDRIVDKADVFSTIYRYSKEKYGVTIINTSGTVIARYDTNTENFININQKDTTLMQKYGEQIKNNIKNKYTDNITLDLGTIYKSGAPWLGNEDDIKNRINADISKEKCKFNEIEYTGIGLVNEISNKTIVEVTKEIDQSEYLKDGEETTSLLQQYQMPTVEIIYILRNKEYAVGYDEWNL